jgi:hypothetical protein
MKTLFVLRHKGGQTRFTCHSATEAELDGEIMKAFWLWKGMQPKGSDKTLKDYMQDKQRARVTIEHLDV